MRGDIEAAIPGGPVGAVYFEIEADTVAVRNVTRHRDGEGRGGITGAVIRIDCSVVFGTVGDCNVWIGSGNVGDDTVGRVRADVFETDAKDNCLGRLDQPVAVSGGIIDVAGIVNDIGAGRSDYLKGADMRNPVLGGNHHLGFARFGESDQRNSGRARSIDMP